MNARSFAERYGPWALAAGGCPGAITTPGHERAAGRAAPGTTTPGRVARDAIGGLGHGFRVVPGRVNQASTAILERGLPKRAVIAILGKASASALRDPGQQPR